MSKSSSTHLLTAELRRLVQAGRPGDSLPSTRDLVARFRVSPVTVSRAVATVAAEGLLVSEPGRGTFVAADDREPRVAADLGWQTVALAERVVDAGEAGRLLQIPEPGQLVLNSGYVDASLQPTHALGEALARAGRRPGAWGRAPVSGIAELRTAMGALAGADPADVLIVPGGQAGLSTAFRALASPGSPVLVESPTYQGALAVARAAGLRPVPVPADCDGVRPEHLDQAFAMTGAKLFYAQPTFANPTGAVLPPERRAAVLDVVRARGAFLIEDDYARELALGAPAPRPLLHDDTDGHVVHLSSLSKVVAPSLRIGALIARGPALARLRALRTVDDFFVGRPLQETAVELLASAAWPRHLSRLRRTLALRRDALVEAVRSELPNVNIERVPQGGLHLWLRLPDGLDDTDVAAGCARRGLLVSPGTPYHAGEPPAPYLRLTYGGADIADLQCGVEVLAAVLRTG
ncbi:MAG: PLP-dependent aminotransferase family protein [Mycobacteriales bacterium]